MSLYYLKQEPMSSRLIFNRLNIEYNIYLWYKREREYALKLFLFCLKLH